MQAVMSILLPTVPRAEFYGTTKFITSVTVYYDSSYWCTPVGINRFIIRGCIQNLWMLRLIVDLRHKIIFYVERWSLHLLPP